MATVLILLILAAALIAYFALRSGEAVRFSTAADPENIIAAAIGLVASRRRWQTLSQGANHVTFQYRQRPNMLVGLILLLCFLIPGILYIMLAGKRQSLAINITAGTAGEAVVQVTSNGFRGKTIGRTLRGRFAQPPALPTAVERPGLSQ